MDTLIFLLSFAVVAGIIFTSVVLVLITFNKDFREQFIKEWKE